MTRANLVAAGLAVAVLAAYALSCWLWPFRDCSVCRGAGVHRSDGSRSLSRPCWWCKGGGKKLRYGRRLWNRWRWR